MYEAQQGQANNQSQSESELQIHDAEANGDGKDDTLKPLGALSDNRKLKYAYQLQQSAVMCALHCGLPQPWLTLT